MIRLSAILLCLLLPVAAWGVTLKANLYETTLALGETSLYQVEVIEAEESGTLHPPKVIGLLIQPTGPPSFSKREIVINGQRSRSQSFIYTYQIIGLQEGRFEVPGFVWEGKGGPLTTPSFKIKILPSKKPANIRLRVEQRLSTLQAYVGQQLEYQILWDLPGEIQNPGVNALILDKEFLDFSLAPPSSNQAREAMIPFNQGKYTLPLYSQPMGPGGVFKTRLLGSFHLVPRQPGEYEFPPVVTRGDWVESYRTTQDFFGRTLRRAQTQPLVGQSNSLRLRVLPLPLPAPAKFSGLVGSTQLHIKALPSHIQEGDPIPLIVTVASQGPTETLKATHFLFPDNFWEYFQLLRLEGQSKQGNHVEWKWWIEAKRPGSGTLPPMGLWVFSPEKAKYELIQSQSQTFEILPAERLEITSASGEAKPVVPQNPALQQISQESPQSGYFPWGFSLLMLPLLWWGLDFWKARKAPFGTPSKAAGPTRLASIQEWRSILGPNGPEDWAHPLATALRAALAQPWMASDAPAATIWLEQIEALRYAPVSDPGEKESLRQALQAWVEGLARQ